MIPDLKSFGFGVAPLGALLIGLFGNASEIRAQAVPESIVQQNVPHIPAELVNALGRYQNTRAASFQGWLADRREVLITTRFADTPQLHHVRMPLGARTQLTFLSERVLGAEPRPGQGQLVYATDSGGAENYQLFFDDMTNSTLTRLTDGKSRNVLSAWSNGGRWISWSSNARNGKDMDLYLADPADPKSARLLKEVNGDWRITDWSPDDRRVSVIERISINESYVHLVDVTDGKSETLTPRAPAGASPVAYDDVRWSKDGKSLFWTSDLDSEFRRLVRYDLATRKSTPLTAGIPWDVESYDLADDGRTVALVANENGLSALHVLDAESGAERPAPSLPAGQISGIKFRKNSLEFAYTFTAARATADVYSYDLATSALTRWTESELGGLNASRFAEPELVRFKSFDGREISAFLYRPGQKFSGPRPVLVNIHGGPESQYRPGFLGRLNYLIDELGVALLFPNVRGSAGYGKSYLQLDNGFKREDSVKDIGALLDWIGTQPNLDASRIAVIGGSYGGYMTLSTLTHYSARLKAGIDIVGISNFVTFLKNTQGYRRDLRRAEYGDERDEAMNAFLMRISPLTNAESIKVPLLVVQGRNDPRVPVTEAEQIVAAVRTQGGPVWYIEGKDEGHGFAKKKNLDYLQAAEILFLKRYLLDEGSPSAGAGAGQQ